MPLLQWVSRAPRIGLELGARTLKVAWLVSRPGGQNEWHFRQQPRRDAEDPSICAQDLAELLRPLHRARWDAHVLVSAPESYFHQLTVRAADARHIPHAIQEQLPSLLPFDLEHTQWQFHVRRQQPVDGGVEAHLAIAACERAAL